MAVGSTTTNTIYLLTNKNTNKVYVGQTWMPLHERMGKDGNGYGNSPHLYASIKKHGVEAFIYEVLALCYDQGTADYLEDYFIKKYNSREPLIGYNLKEGGSAGKHSEVTKKKISETLKNKEWSPEALEGRSKISKYWKGKKRGPQSEERKQAQADKLVEWHATHEHPMQGKHHSDEIKLGISNKIVGTKRSQEVKDAIAAKHKIPSEKEQQIIELYTEDTALSQIKEICNCGINTIYRVLRRNNISIKQPMTQRIVKIKPKKEVSPEELLIIADFKENKLTMAGVCDKHGIAYDTLYRILERNNIPRQRS